METTTTSILIAGFLLILAFFSFNKLFGSSSYWRSKGIPTVPGALPIFGNTLSVHRTKKSLSTLCRELYEKYPGKSMIGFYNMEKPTLLLREPELVKTVLQTSFKAFQHNELVMDLELDPLLGGDIFFMRGQAWKDARAIFSSIFSIKKLKRTSQTIERVCGEMENYVASRIEGKNSLELEAKIFFSRYTAEVATRSLFSIDGQSFHEDYSNTLLEALETTLEPSVQNSLSNSNGVWSLLPFATKSMQRSFVPPKVDRFFRKIVNEVEEMQKRESATVNDVSRMMLELAGSKKISRDEALSHMFSFIIESFETSSLTLSFAACLLAKNPKIQETLRTEVETIMAKHEGRMTHEAVSEMDYAERVILETMRLFPPAGHLLKVCAEKYCLRGSDGLNLEVEPGTSVIVPLMGLHTDPTIWDDPESFDPDRFDRANTENRHKFAFLPFGEGPRACPGSRLAMFQVKAALATVLRNYRIQLSPKMMDPFVIDPRYFLTTALGGFWIVLESIKNR